jgi:hypothetical protein
MYIVCFKYIPVNKMYKLLNSNKNNNKLLLFANKYSFLSVGICNEIFAFRFLHAHQRGIIKRPASNGEKGT